MKRTRKGWVCMYRTNPTVPIIIKKNSFAKTKKESIILFTEPLLDYDFWVKNFELKCVRVLETYSIDIYEKKIPKRPRKK